MRTWAGGQAGRRAGGQAMVVRGAPGCGSGLGVFQAHEQLHRQTRAWHACYERFLR